MQNCALAQFFERGYPTCNISEETKGGFGAEKAEKKLSAWVAIQKYCEHLKLVDEQTLGTQDLIVKPKFFHWPVAANG